MVNEKTTSLQNQVRTLQTQLDQQSKQSINKQIKDDNSSFREVIANAVEDFETVDTNPEFETWLKGLDAYGVPRMDSFRAARSAKDIGRIVSFYNDFKQIQTPPTVDPRELNQQPDSTSTSTATNTQPKFSRAWDMVAIQEFYRDSALGKYTPAEAVKLEQEILDYKRGGNR